MQLEILCDTTTNKWLAIREQPDDFRIENSDFAIQVGQKVVLKQKDEQFDKINELGNYDFDGNIFIEKLPSVEKSKG